MGDVYGRLTILQKVGRKRLVRCECGTEKLVLWGNLRRGITRSCGCLRRELLKSRPRNVRHGMQGSVEYEAWRGMKSRCSCRGNPAYRYYGGRGIRVCAEWRSSFEAFYRDVGPRPSHEHSIDRIDVNGNYEPGNVRWATHTQQMRNRRNTRMLTVYGDTRPLVEWAALFGLTRNALAYRLQRGDSAIDALLSVKP